MEEEKQKRSGDIKDSQWQGKIERFFPEEYGFRFLECQKGIQYSRGIYIE